MSWRVKPTGAAIGRVRRASRCLQGSFRAKTLGFDIGGCNEHCCDTTRRYSRLKQSMFESAFSLLQSATRFDPSSFSMIA